LIIKRSLRSNFSGLGDSLSPLPPQLSPDFFNFENGFHQSGAEYCTLQSLIIKNKFQGWDFRFLHSLHSPALIFLFESGFGKKGRIPVLWKAEEERVAESGFFVHLGVTLQFFTSAQTFPYTREASQAGRLLIRKAKQLLIS
jgi:hypothetical protein